MRKWIIGIIILLAIGGVAFVLLRPDGEEPQPETGEIEAPPDFGTVEASPRVVAEAEVVPIESVELQFEISGVIDQVLVEEGSTVQEGDPLAVLDTRDLELNLERARAELDAAQADYDDLIDGATAEEIAIREAAVRNAEADVTRAQSEIGSAESSISRNEAGFAKSQSGVSSAQAEVAAAQARVQAADASVAAAQASVESAAAAVTRSEANYASTRGNVTQSDIDAAQAAVDEAQATLDDMLKWPHGSKEPDLQNAQATLDRLIATMDDEKARLSATKTNAQSLMEVRANELRDAQASYSEVYWQIREIERELNTVDQELWQDQKDREEQALRNVRNAEEELEQARINFEEAREAEIAGIQAAEANVRDARAALDDLLEGAKDFELAQSREALADAKASLEKLIGERRQGDLQSAAADVQSARAELARAQADQQRAQADAQDARAALSKAIAQVDSSQADVASSAADVANSIAGVTTAESGLERAQADLERVQAELADLTADPTQTEIAAQKAVVDQREVAVKQAEVDLDDATLTAPIDGTVVEFVPKEGERISGNQYVATVGDLSAWEIETTDLDELGIVRVEIGNDATISFDALPDLEVPGEVKEIQALGKNSQGDIVYKVTVTPLEWDPRIRWKMTATVAIEPSVQEDE